MRILYVKMKQTMYNEEILDMYSQGLNRGDMKDKTHEFTHKNPICGDVLTLQLKVDEGKIIDAKFTASGCFISSVSASALTEKIKGMKVEDAKKLKKEDLDKLLGIEIIATRIKCELLVLEALKEALK